MPIKQMDKEARAAWVRKALDEADVPSTGRVSRLVEQTGLSRPTLTTIIHGGLPRDLAVACEFSLAFGLDIHEWVVGEARPGHASPAAPTR